MRPAISSHVLRRVSKFVPREFTGSLTGPSSGEKRKKKEKEEKNRDATGKEEGRVRERETEEGDSYHLARLRRRLTQRGYRGRLDGHIEGARST